MVMATVLHVPSARMGDFYFCDNQVALARELYESGQYQSVVTIDASGTGVNAAEYVFELTNDPGMQYERDGGYGYMNRSVSVGDIIVVDDVPFMCASCGWEQL